jgi:hypothetical protein
MTQAEFISQVNALRPFTFTDRLNQPRFAFPAEPYAVAPTMALPPVGAGVIATYDPIRRVDIRFDGDIRRILYIYSLDDGFVGVHFEDTGKGLWLHGAAKFETVDGYRFAP